MFLGGCGKWPHPQVGTMPCGGLGTRSADACRTIILNPKPFNPQPHISYSPNCIPLKKPYDSPVYKPLYNPPLRSFDHSSHTPGIICTSAGGDVFFLLSRDAGLRCFPSSARPELSQNRSFFKLQTLEFFRRFLPFPYIPSLPKGTLNPNF